MFERIKVAKARSAILRSGYKQEQQASTFASLWSKYNTHLDELQVDLTVSNNLAKATVSEQQARENGQDFEAADWMAQRIFYTAVADSMREARKPPPPVWR